MVDKTRRKGKGGEPHDQLVNCLSSLIPLNYGPENCEAPASVRPEVFERVKAHREVT